MLFWRKQTISFSLSSRFESTYNKAGLKSPVVSMRAGNRAKQSRPDTGDAIVDPSRLTGVDSQVYI